MKYIIHKLIVVLCVCLISNHSVLLGQANHSHKDALRKKLPVVPQYKFTTDSIVGFDESELTHEIMEEKFSIEDAKRITYLRKRNYIDEKYFIGKFTLPKTPNTNAFRQGGTGNATTALNCAAENFDFENGSGTGWTLSGNTTIVSGGVDPYGGYPHVFPGGSFSLRISDDVSASGDWGQAVKTIAVPATGTTLFTFHFAMSIFNYPHAASDAAKFKVDFFDGAGNPIACPKYECYHSTDNGDVGVSNFTATTGPASQYNPSAVGDTPGGNGATSSNWNNVTLDLSGYAGQTITARFRIDWCIYGPDWAYCFIDASCPVFNFAPISVCSGVGSPICGPTSMLTYSWTTPSGATPTTSCITATSAGIYTLNCVPTNVQCSAAPIITYLYDVKPTPIPDFTYTLTPCQTTLSVPFADNTNLNGGSAISSYTWHWGDGTANGTIANQTHTYATPGTKTITLIASNGACSDSIKKTINITLKPNASYSVNAVCKGLANTFSDLSSVVVAPDVISSWAWDYTNDGIIDNTTQNPTFIFSNSGTFTTALIATSSNGCKDTVTKVVSVYGHAIPNFMANSVCYNSVTSFTNTTDIITQPNTGTINSWSWTFGDLTSSPNQTPNHTYTTPSNSVANTTYSVQLVVNTNHNCIDSISKTVTVYSNPTPSFTADTVCFNMASHLLDASNGNGNTVTNYHWDFTNDNIAEINGVSNPNYIFLNAGNNTVNYTVTTLPEPGLSCSSYTTENVWVNPLPQPAFSFTNACINAQPLLFDANASSILIGSNILYSWAFGDGATANGIINTHTFAMANSYNTTLTVTSNKGCLASLSHSVEVYQKPLLSIAASSLVCFGNATSFTAVSLPNSGNTVLWQWDVNNSISSFEITGQQSSYTFPTAGTQTIALVSTTNHNCKDTINRTTYVNYLPKPDFTVDKPHGCPLPHCVKFADNSPMVALPAHIVNWNWNYGDGTTTSSATNTIQSHCYFNSSSNQLALFTVTLTTTTDSGCVASNVKPNFITVYPTPIANYTIVPEFGDVVVPLVHFMNQSVDYTKWWWSFGDGPMIDSLNINPNHYYPDNEAGTYHSMLIVSNQYHCRDTARVLVEIAPDFIFYIPNCFTPNDDNINDVFTGKGIGINTYEMWIYDRWGATIYYTDDITKGWNGRVQGKDNVSPQDVYTWKVELEDVLGKKHNYIGHVTLLK